MSLPTATELLRDADARRPRSLQQEMGISELGGCRRKAGYRTRGVPPDPGFAGDGGMQAILGTGTHELIAAATRQSAKIPPGAEAESLEVTFAGLKGHPDLYCDGVLRDYKTVGYKMQLARLKATGPWQNHLWQVNIYAAALILSGRPVTAIEIDYIARDSGDEHIWSGPFDVSHVRDAIAWLELVKGTEPDMLPRDYRPESPQCETCPFFARCWESLATPGRSLRTALYTDNPDAAYWAAKLESAREARAVAEGREADARGALDALRTVERPGERQDVEIEGYEKVVRFSVAHGSQGLDKEQIYADYKRAGALPPMVRGKPKITVTLVGRDE